jgi:hypothetical protein
VAHNNVPLYKNYRQAQPGSRGSCTRNDTKVSSPSSDLDDQESPICLSRNHAMSRSATTWDTGFQRMLVNKDRHSMKEGPRRALPCKHHSLRNRTPQPCRLEPLGRRHKG